MILSGRGLDGLPSNCLIFKTVASIVVATIFHSFGCCTLAIVFAVAFLYFAHQVYESRIPAKYDEFSVIVIGAGASGICAGVKLKEAGFKFRILEKNSKLGGTWRTSVYPGAACDSPAHLYSFSFCLNPWWSRQLAPQKEILSYLEEVASRFGVYPHIQFNTEVRSAVWNDATRRWTVTTGTGEKLEANFVVSGVGMLRVPRIPEFKGQSDFGGVSLHCANWPEEGLDVEGKRVAVIGTGATGVQVIPAIAEKVSKLYVFQRSPGWAPPKFDNDYSLWQKRAFYYFPPYMWFHRWIIFWVGELFNQIVLTRGQLQFAKDFLLKLFIKQMKAEIPEGLDDKMIPKYEIGCKRMIPSDAYLKSFKRDNVDLVTEKIDHFDTNGIWTSSGEHIEVDVVLYATGYNAYATVAESFEVRGRDGKSLKDEWGDTPSAYVGTSYPGFPNLFFSLGPNTTLAHSSAWFVIEYHATHAVDAMKRLVRSGYTAIDVKKKVYEEYVQWLDEKMSHKVFNPKQAEDRCWYQNEKGKNYTIWPGDLITFWWLMRKCDVDKYNLF